jgi:predicted ATP-binding protein involved in virulence
MRIDSIEIQNFKNYESLYLTFAPGINLFVGSNGSGKTSILEAVNVALGGFFGEQEQKMQRQIELSEVMLYMHNNKPIRSEKTSIKAYSKVVGDDWVRNFNGITKNNDVKYVRPASTYGSKILKKILIPDNRDIAPLISYYSTQRLFKDASQSAKQRYDAAIGRRNGYLQCLKDNAIKGTLVEWLGNAVTRRATKQIQEIDATDLILENVERAVKKTLAFFLDDFDATQLKIYQEPDFEFELFIQLNEISSLPISYYSDGFRNLIYLIIDLIWRASQLNPWLTLEELTLKQTGSVTIDEIDLHLHPKWQSKAIGILQELLPNVQFFITTHSPTVVANFKQRTNEDDSKIDSLYILENNNCTEIISSFYGRDINSVLGNPMDANTRAFEVLNEINRFNLIVANTESTDADYEIAFEIATKLSEILPGTDKELIRINEIASRIKTIAK